MPTVTRPDLCSVRVNGDFRCALGRVRRRYPALAGICTETARHLARQSDGGETCFPRGSLSTASPVGLYWLPRTDEDAICCGRCAGEEHGAIGGESWRRARLSPVDRLDVAILSPAGGLPHAVACSLCGNDVEVR